MLGILISKQLHVTKAFTTNRISLCLCWFMQCTHYCLIYSITNVLLTHQNLHKCVLLPHQKVKGIFFYHTPTEEHQKWVSCNKIRAKSFQNWGPSTGKALPTENQHFAFSDNRDEQNSHLKQLFCWLFVKLYGLKLHK